MVSPTRPALRALRRERIPISGPLPADTVFRELAKDRYDLALAAYHDQGMIPLKLHAPERLVNITLGLPFMRTSPGHGTAYDIADEGLVVWPGAGYETEVVYPLSSAGPLVPTIRGR